MLNSLLVDRLLSPRLVLRVRSNDHQAYARKATPRPPPPTLPFQLNTDVYLKSKADL